MGNWSQWSHNISRKSRLYQRRVRPGKGWCRLCPYQPCYSCSLKKISVSSFIPNDSKWASGAMSETAEAEVATGEAEKKTVAYGVASLSRVTGWSVTSFALLYFISLLLCFIVPVFVYVNVFAFQRVANFKRISIKKKEVAWWWE